MYDESEDIEVTQEDKELLERIEGFHFWYNEVTYAIFENATTFPSSISFLIKIPASREKYGAITVTNPFKGTYLRRACKDRKVLDAVYELSKKKILSRNGLSLGWEGKINDARYS